MRRETSSVTLATTTTYHQHHQYETVSSSRQTQINSCYYLSYRGRPSQHSKKNIPKRNYNLCIYCRTESFRLEGGSVMMDESSQAAVMPSESLHDILKCELEEENEKLLQSSHFTTFDNQLDDGESKQPDVEHSQPCQHSQDVEEACREREKERKPTQSAWSQTPSSRHHQTVKIDLSLKVRPGRPEPSSSSSGKKLTLVRGSSLSLVDLPTFLPSSVRLGKLASISHLIQNIPIHKQLQQRREGGAGSLPLSDKTMGKKSQWTVMCVALGFFSTCLILVGCMLSITSEYQDQAIARMLNMSLEDIQTKG